MKLLGKNIFIFPQEEEKEVKTKSGLVYTPKNEVQTSGKVYKVGDEVEKVKVGDKVLFRSFNKVKVKDEYLLVKEDEILAIL